MTLPPDVFLPPPAPSDPWDPTDLRVGQFLGRAVRNVDDARIVLVGFPSDTGVRRNGGRPGAREALAPSARRFTASRPTPAPEKPSPNCWRTRSIWATCA
ncbi:hypothetical protein [Rhodothermus marinus]|uniref:hypothetical protein n=1 Tax=Rhodothermus marinus TaxID=29549 RepID=UPI000B1A5C49|nr:hypothetical protein [Rhodothermus marinus]